MKILKHLVEDVRHFFKELDIKVEHKLGIIDHEAKAEELMTEAGVHKANELSIDHPIIGEVFDLFNDVLGS